MKNKTFDQLVDIFKGTLERIVPDYEFFEDMEVTSEQNIQWIHFLDQIYAETGWSEDEFKEKANKILKENGYEGVF